MDRTRIDPQVPAQRPASSLPEPRSMGEYRVLRRLGEGGMGSVYLAYEEGQDRQVALKVLPDTLASNPAYVDRFYREARSATSLNHPNIVRGLNVGQDRSTGQYYLVMEYVDGPSGLELLERYGRLSVADAVHIALDIGRALEHAHSRNIVHRDIKPDNILLTQSGVAKLADLGLAKRMDEKSHLTATRQGFGTPYYMPYEQAINAKRADARSDIYALGGTLYHFLTGQVPFPGNNHLEVMDAKNRGEFIPASMLNPEIPLVLDQILDRMLARDPRDRYQSASELLVEMERSRLSASVPSFADPELAMKDPWVLACMQAANQPTIPDTQANGNGKAATEDVWFLRVCDDQGRWHKSRATKEQIVRQLRAGRLSPQIEAGRTVDGEFTRLSDLPEFRLVRREPARKPRPAESATEVDLSPQIPRRLGFGWFALAAAIAITLFIGTWVVLLPWFRQGHP